MTIELIQLFDGSDQFLRESRCGHDLPEKVMVNRGEGRKEIPKEARSERQAFDRKYVHGSVQRNNILKQVATGNAFLCKRDLGVDNVA